ncbi:headbutt [Carabus blaptoides fortunei]
MAALVLLTAGSDRIDSNSAELQKPTANPILQHYVWNLQGGMKLEIWRKEFTLQSLSMQHDRYTDFFTSQWQKGDSVNFYYLLYRVAMALVFFVTLLLSVIDINNPEETAVNRAKWLIYLTHWGYAVCTIQAFMSCYIVIYMYRKVRKRDEPITEVQISPKLCASYWVLFIIATDAAFAITCIYWSLIFDVQQHPLDAMNIFVHGINSVLMMTDLFVVAHPVRLLHCYWPFSFAILYIAFNVIYYMAGGTDKHGQHYIYAILDWQSPGRSTLTAFLALMFLVFLHLLTYCMFLLRKRIYIKLYKSKNDKNSFNLSPDVKNHNISPNSNLCSDYL